MRRWAMIIWCFVLCLGVVVGFAGAVHPLGDTVSLVRPVLGGLCAVTLLWRGPRLLRAGLAIAAVMALATTVPMMILRTPEGALTVYSKNLWWANEQIAAVADDIRTTNPDIVLLQEVSARNDQVLALLAATYPHQHLCQFSGWNGIAILSKSPMTDQSCTQRRGAALAQINTPAGAIWATSIHLGWPHPYSNMRSAEDATDLLADLDAPVIMGGDFNIFPWAASVRQLQHVTRTQIAGPVRPTYQLNAAPLLLDHIHAPFGGSATLRPLLGSDHKGVLARVSLRP